tara:strand:+ start:2119 stop:2244 length:126 start_codon:yes stop_codon:yes gene_type:complete
MANLLMLIFGCSLIGMETSLQIGIGTFIAVTVIVSELKEKK